MQGLPQQIEEAVTFIRGRAGDVSPRVGIIFGTGLSSLREDVKDDQTISYDDIPHFVTSTVESHHGELLLGTLEGQPVVAMRGRFHAYEGYSFQEITFPVKRFQDGKATMAIALPRVKMIPLPTY